MLQLLSPDAVVMSNGAIGTQAASSFVGGVMALDMSALQIDCACINGGWGATFLQHGKIMLALSLEMDGPAIRTVYAITDPGRYGPAVLQSIQEAVTA